jgi:hypothetical protein
VSSYPYIIFPQLLLNFIAENSFEGNKAVSRQKNHGKIQNFLAKQAVKGELIIISIVREWSILQHILLKLPIGIISFATALICTIKGVPQLSNLYRRKSDKLKYSVKKTLKTGNGSRCQNFKRGKAPTLVVYQ